MNCGLLALTNYHKSTQNEVDNNHTKLAKFSPPRPLALYTPNSDFSSSSNSN